MSVTFDLAGLDAELAALRALPEAMAGEAAHIIEGASNATVSAIRQRYPIGPTGNLVKRVTATVTRKGVSTTARIRSGAPHAHLYEFGTAARHTAAGANRGRTRPTYVFLQEYARSQREVTALLRALLERQGFQVAA